MRRKNNSSQVITKDYLRKELETVEKSLHSEIKLSAEEILVKVDEKAKKYRDQILTSNDSLAKKLEEMRDENIIGSGQTSQLREQVESHEKRIKSLEKIQQVA